MEEKELYTIFYNIEKKIETIYEELRELERTEKDITIKNQKKEKLYKQLESLFNKRMEIKKELYFMIPPIKSNNIIDLRCIDTDPTKYSIYIHNTRMHIGDIEYRDYHNSHIGDIGYRIDSNFRGNNYAYQALVLLSQKLYEDGINDFWVLTTSDNVASIKTIEKYGGRLINKPSKIKLLYECDTNRYIPNINQSKQKR